MGIFGASTLFLKESQNMNKFLYWEWKPQIMYNHHQTGPPGTVIFVKPQM